MGRIAHHTFAIQLPDYKMVVELDRDLIAWRDLLPPFFSMTNVDRSFDAAHPYLFVQRHLLSCEWYYARITLNRPYLLRRKSQDGRYAYSKKAAIDSATADLLSRRAFVMEKGNLLTSGGYRVSVLSTGIPEFADQQPQLVYGSRRDNQAYVLALRSMGANEQSTRTLCKRTSSGDFSTSFQVGLPMHKVECQNPLSKKSLLSWTFSRPRLAPRVQESVQSLDLPKIRHRWICFSASRRQGPGNVLLRKKSVNFVCRRIVKQKRPRRREATFPHHGDTNRLRSP